ncbi:MAG: uracil-DNA glycosylase [Deltaproteobacteria bacterium]|nr:MAG: uracil-DNA glycosylase [Deltaproteobacteria bacterium]
MPERLLSELREAIAAGRSRFEYLRDLGLDEVPAGVRGGPTEPGRAPGRESLEEVRAALGDCQRCGLCGTRKTLVFGVGNPSARLVLVGEAPGREEDEKGEPFVGEAGRLLDRILFAMGLSRDDVYICNVLKCRPPNNRDPEPDEIATCEPFLIRQLAAIQPQMIVALGRFAIQTLLQTKAPISRLRGTWQQYQGIPLMPTYHPAYLLRNPAGKREVWSDMKQVMERLRVGAG